MFLFHGTLQSTRQDIDGAFCLGHCGKVTKKTLYNDVGGVLRKLQKLVQYLLVTEGAIITLGSEGAKKGNSY